MVVMSLVAVITIALTTISILVFVSIKKTSVDKENLVKLTHIMADNISASVLFDDKESANVTLSFLKSDPNIEGAFIFLNDHQEYAAYVNKQNSKQKLNAMMADLLKKGEILLGKQGSYIDFSNIIVFKPIFLHKKYIATLVVVSSTKQTYSAIKEVTSILLIVFMIVLLITLFISSRLKRNFTKPIYILIDNIQYIINNSKYDKKITLNRCDEFQILYDGFNTLLDTIDQQTKELQFLASIDPMTKLYNRRYLTDISEHMIELAKRNKTQLSLIMIDIDFFKSINDRYGHKNGDTVIMTVAKTLKSITRTSDLVCRFGGEEFIILLPQTGIEGAVKISEKIRKSIENLAIATQEGEKIHFTVSCGVSAVNVEKDKNIENATQKADEALYEAKKCGRNRVVFL